jgi:succinoglycan biosynthesis transport protein ExoP
MNFPQILDLLRVHYKIILTTLIATVLSTLLISILLPKSYKATATLVLNYKGTDPVTGFTLPAQLMPGYMATQVDIIKSQSVAQRVADELKLADNPKIKEDFANAGQGQGTLRVWLGNILSKQVDVVPSHESSVVEVSVVDSDAKLAADLANSFVKAYQQTSVQLKVEPLRQASSYFNDQIKVLKENFETAQARLSKYQHEKGIINSDSHVDNETTRLNDLATQLGQVGGQLRDASLRLQKMQESGADSTQEIIASPLIHSLSTALAAAEGHFAEIAARFGSAHPAYRSAKAEVDRLRANLEASKSSIATGLQNNVAVLNQREAQLQSALEQQKARILDLNYARGEMAVLERELQNAQRAYETTAQRFTQLNLEGQSNQSDIAVLTPAVAPMMAASPKIVRNTLFSVLVGSLLGIGFAVLAEMIDRRVRSAGDLVNALRVPVLGVIEWQLPTRRRRLLGRLMAPQRLALQTP